MPWGRMILAALATLFVCGGMASLVVMGAGLWRPDFASAPGMNAQDAAALAAPYNDVRQGRDAAILARLAARNERTQDEIDQIQSLLPPGEPASSRLTSFRVQAGTDGNRLWGIREYEYPGHVVRSETTLYRAADNDPWMVEGFHVNVVTREQLAANVFSFPSEPPGVQAVIVASIVVPLFTLFTFLVALFRPSLKLRWPWLLAIALGVGTVYANTGTNALTFLPVSVQLFGAGATWSGSAFDGWVFSVSTPFGAAVFWLTRLFGKRSADADAPA